MKKFNKPVKTALELTIIALFAFGSYVLYQYFFYINTAFAEAHGVNNKDIMMRVDLLNIAMITVLAVVVFAFFALIFKDTGMFDV